MRRSALTLAILTAAAAFALLPAVAPERSSASTAATTVFKGRFVCGEEPLAGARVDLLGEPRAYSSFLGIHLADFRIGFTVRGTVYAGSQGEWSFTVPRTKSVNYHLVATLDDGRGTIVTGFPSADAISATPGAGGTNFDDIPLQDYHTQAYPGAECALWLALKDAYQDYARLTGKRPPYGGVVAQYDAPNRGMPYAAYTTIVWPKNYPVSDAAVRHEFAHTIRNASLGSEDAFLDEVSQEDFRVRGDSCRRTSPQYAFHEGWAEFWAGDFFSAPNCPGARPDDAAVEGKVAWTLTRLARNCAAVSRKRMVEVLLAQGRKIHSLADFARALGVGSASCLATPLDPASVPRTKARPPVSDERWIRDLQAGLTATRHRGSQLTRLLPGADRAAVGARCPRPPCLDAIGRKLAPSLIRGQIAQGHTGAAILQTALTIDAGSMRGRPTRQFLESVTRTPQRLSSAMAKIGVDSIDKALAAARPLATRDHSERTRSVLAVFRSQRSALLHVASSGAGVHTYHRAVAAGCPRPTGNPWLDAFNLIFCWPGWSESTKRTSTVPTNWYQIDFWPPDGKRGAITFGSAAALGFRGGLPKYVCPEGPTTTPVGGTEWGIAPACPAPDAGFAFYYSGMLGKLRFPARSVRAYVGATQAIPGGLAAELDGFDAAGVFVSGTATLVGSSTNNGKSFEDKLLELTPALHAHPIVYVALYVNHPIPSAAGVDSREPPRLAIDSLGYREKPR